MTGYATYSDAGERYQANERSHEDFLNEHSEGEDAVNNARDVYTDVMNELKTTLHMNGFKGEGIMGLVAETLSDALYNACEERDPEYLAYHLQGESWLADKTIDAAIKADIKMTQQKRWFEQ